MPAFYREDLARIHDEGFTELVGHAGAFVVDSLKRRGFDRGRRSDEEHFQNLYDAGSLARQLRREGFRVVLRRSYGSYRLGAGATAIVARKPPQRPRFLGGR